MMEAKNIICLILTVAVCMYSLKRGRNIEREDRLRRDAVIRRMGIKEPFDLASGQEQEQEQEQELVVLDDPGMFPGRERCQGDASLCKGESSARKDVEGDSESVRAASKPLRESKDEGDVGAVVEGSCGDESREAGEGGRGGGCTNSEGDRNSTEGSLKEKGVEGYENDEDDEDDDDILPASLCAAGASELVQCVLSSGGRSGMCRGQAYRACLERTGRARRTDERHMGLTKHGPISLVHADAFESLALLLYEEWMPWASSVLDQLLAQTGGDIIDVCPGVGGLTLALARSISTRGGRVYAVEPRQLLRRALDDTSKANREANISVSGACMSSPSSAEKRIPDPSPDGGGDVGRFSLGETGPLVECGTLDSHWWVDAGSGSNGLREGDEENRGGSKGLGGRGGRGGGVGLLRVSSCGDLAPLDVVKGANRLVTEYLPIVYVESSRGERAAKVEALLSSMVLKGGGLEGTAGAVGVGATPPQTSGAGYRCFWSAGRMRAGGGVFPPGLSLFNQLCVPPRIELHGLVRVADDPWHKAGQMPLDELVLREFATPNLELFHGARRVHSSPDVWVIDGFLAEDECDALMVESRERLRGSRVGVPLEEGASAQSDDSRRSQSAHLVRGRGKSGQTALEARATALLNVSLSRFESPQVVRYVEGGKFEQHLDSLPLSAATSDERVAADEMGGQRIATLITYLSTVAPWGGTTFPLLNVSVSPVKGRALLFFPADASGVPDQMSMHLGESVGPGQDKWIATMWLRRNKVVARPRGAEKATE